MSSIWPGIKLAASINRPYMGWLVGNGANIDFWRDTWATEIPLREYIEMPQSLWKICTTRLRNLINSNGWDIPTNIRILLLALGINVLEIPCNPREVDKRIWKPDSYENFTVRNPYETIRKKRNTTWWWKYTWRESVYPKLGCFAWRLVNHILSLNEIVKKMGIHITSCCTLCRLQEESEAHLLLHFPSATNIWLWATDTFFLPSISSTDTWKSILEKSRPASSYINDLWITNIFSICQTIWSARNSLQFDDTTPSMPNTKRGIIKKIQYTAKLSKGKMHNN
ncbi:hypothetical protein GIB67_027582 [Kingdonia uniflora]|uniref:Reverse transcriptase zinc-binding domain-containing protein n=1 Tax=Kingdonia uniflora TaxID=39325 RepID=A0A7J7NLE6_9MAGN|nr:hypothetical protein GIB67_027582 [Kingdonia uniflora]